MEKEGLVKNKTVTPHPGIAKEIPGVATERNASGAPSDAIVSEPVRDLYEMARTARTNLRVLGKTMSNPVIIGVDGEGETYDSPDGSGCGRASWQKHRSGPS